jgi:hypothetical protein
MVRRRVPEMHRESGGIEFGSRAELPVETKRKDVGQCTPASRSVRGRRFSALGMSRERTKTSRVPQAQQLWLAEAGDWAADFNQAWVSRWIDEGL